MLSVLNVAEKPSVAKSISDILSQGNKWTEFSNAKMNPVFSFTYHIEGEQCKMYFTSVRGHLTCIEFCPKYRSWNRISVEELFTAPISTNISKDCKDIEKNLLHYSKICDKLILWLDCDKEGEAIAFEVIDVCKRVNKNMKIRRAIFSAVTESDIEFACDNLRDPNRNLAMAVEARQEIDLRIGSSMTRFMTIKYKDMINTEAKVLSYGPCQLPTLGFVVERFEKIENFIRETFWSIKVEIEGNHGQETTLSSFQWDRNRIFDRLAVLTLYEVCLENPLAFVTRVNTHQTKKYPPLPLDTVEMHKNATKNLKISSSQCMQIAESLYNKGYISYPRTETNAFPKTLDLPSIIKTFLRHPIFGDYAKRLMDGLYSPPLMGKNNDEAHPPIHPVKPLEMDAAESILHWKLYEYITRRFLACCSPPAFGDENLIFLDISGERFYSRGLIVRERNWLDIYPYSKWIDKSIPDLVEGQEILPKKIILLSGETKPPPLLSESNLIELMNKNGIGTDATMHEHIQKIQDRHYAIKNSSLVFIPTNLGRAIYKAFKRYTTNSIDLTKPELRARMERDMSEIACGKKEKQQVVNHYSILMRNIFWGICRNLVCFDSIMRELVHLNPDDTPLPNTT